MIRQLVDEQDRGLGPDHRAVGGGTRDARPAQLGGLRQPVECLGLTGQLDHPDVGRQEGQERREQGGLAHMLVLGRDDDRDARLEQQPELRGKLGVERPVADQRDDRSRLGRDGSERPAARGGRGIGHDASVWAWSESVNRAPRGSQRTS